MTVYEAQARIAEIRSRIGLGAPMTTGGGDAFAATLQSTLDSSRSVTGTAVVDAAKRYLGTPYVFGGTNPESGLDCSGLVQRVYADLGVKLPRVAEDQAREGTAVPDMAHARSGDLLAFGNPVDHIGIYAGGDKMIVAPHTGDVVKIQQVYETPSAIRRIVPTTSLDPSLPGGLPGGSPGGLSGALSAAALTGALSGGLAGGSAGPGGALGGGSGSLAGALGGGSGSLAGMLGGASGSLAGALGGGSGTLGGGSAAALAMSAAGARAGSAPAASMAASATMRPAALTGVPYADLFQRAGAKYGLSPALLAAVAKVESGYNPAAVSSAGAQGLMQIMPATARGLGVNALDPAQAVDGAARMLSANLERFGSIDLALAAYNAGGGAVSRYGGIPPFAQTQAYVPKVKAAMEQLAGRGFA
ncbi:transglycosylase SLT domain-containing protein [Dactylosporangium sp. NPDC005555]|uniref:transglycosylase SLT domain-containing protein n=1 Tax=Dactylosporangium sp. NPDC005555 TaxID=3154889 RepID=UPI0033A38DB6